MYKNPKRVQKKKQLNKAKKKKKKSISKKFITITRK